METAWRSSAPTGLGGGVVAAEAGDDDGVDLEGSGFEVKPGEVDEGGERAERRRDRLVLDVDSGWLEEEAVDAGGTKG